MSAFWSFYHWNLFRSLFFIFFFYLKKDERKKYSLYKFHSEEKLNSARTSEPKTFVRYIYFQIYHIWSIGRWLVFENKRKQVSKHSLKVKKLYSLCSKESQYTKVSALKLMFVISWWKLLQSLILNTHCMVPYTNKLPYYYLLLTAFKS